MKITEVKINPFKLLLIVSLLAVFTLLFSSCGPTDPISKEEIQANISNESNLERDYATAYLTSWGMPDFFNTKTQGIEIVYRDYYVKDLPSAYEMAKATAELFLEYFYDDIDKNDKDAVTDALIVCYVESVGDKYSVYRTKEEYDFYGDDMSGTFSGIGVSVIYSYIDLTMTVTEVMSGSGAEDAGIKAGDLIIAANGVPVTELGYLETISTIRGEEGTLVDVTVLRGDEEITFSVQRRKIVEESVNYSLGEDKIGYIEISSFKSNTVSQFKDAIDYMVDNGAVGMVYDLRANPGGYLSSVLDMLSYIAPKGTTLVSFTNNYAPSQLSNSEHVVALPTVVICDENTASAGELFTAAMRDFGKMDLFDVTVVGKTTYGKGVMQTSYGFTDGSAITLTVAYYNPPSGVNYDGIGITPDIIAELEEEGDSQLDAAMNEIKKLIK